MPIDAISRALSYLTPSNPCEASVKVILYDTLSNLSGNFWSPNTAKPRFTMDYKGIPFVII
ncbi:hypothetical protein BDR03DRAFT_180226 [Suillus americanus]|nr:hypothetical protein BDR03DRAFT_180226 [Suillus americanus]